VKTAVWRKNLDRYKQGQKEKVLTIVGAINEQMGTGFSEAGTRVEETAGLVRGYIKPTNYERLKTQKFREDISKRENMSYDVMRDEYICANNKKLRVIETETRVSKSGYEGEVTVYDNLKSRYIYDNSGGFMEKAL
jgi:hypothetical protein